MSRRSGQPENSIAIDVPILDRVGQPITPGSLIAYGHALGRCAGLRLGKVLKVTGWIIPAIQSTFHNYPERREYRLTIHGIDDDSFDINQPDQVSWRGEKYDIKLLDKKSTLQFPSRVVVLDPQMVPQAYRDLFDTVSL